MELKDNKNYIGGEKRKQTKINQLTEFLDKVNKADQIASNYKKNPTKYSNDIMRNYSVVFNLRTVMWEVTMG